MRGHEWQAQTERSHRFTSALLRARCTPPIEELQRSDLLNKPKRQRTGTGVHPEAGWKSREGILDRDKDRRRPSLGQALVRWDFMPACPREELWAI